MMPARRVRDLCRSGKESCDGEVELMSFCLVAIVNHRGHREETPQTSKIFLCILCGKCLRSISDNFCRRLDCIARVNPRARAAGYVQQIRKTSLLHDAGGGAGTIAASPDDRG